MTPARPRSTAELAALIADAAVAREQVRITGSGSLPLARFDPARPIRDISTLRLNKILDHAVADMTVTLQAGISLEALQRELAWKNQWLPLDPPALAPRVPGARTLGGLIATNSLGPLREIAATNDFRRLLLGITWIDAAGRILHAGGRTMKNAAGYQLQRLMTGACGTLGILAEVTLRTAARPDDEAAVTFYCPTPESAAQLAAEIRLAPVTPAYLQLIPAQTFAANPLSLPAGDAVCLTVGFLDRPAAARAQIDVLRCLPAAEGLESLSLNAAQCGRLRLWMTAEPLAPEGTLPFRLHTLPSRAAALTHALGRQENVWLVAEANAALLRGHAPPRTLEKLLQPPDCLAFPRSPGSADPLVTALKSALDPHHLLGSLP